MAKAAGVRLVRIISVSANDAVPVFARAEMTMADEVRADHARRAPGFGQCNRLLGDRPAIVPRPNRHLASAGPESILGPGNRCVSSRFGSWGHVHARNRKPFRHFSRHFSLLLFAAHAAEAQGVRVALIIGNSHYVAVGVLANPVNDAADVAQSFADIGFEVTHLDDLTANDMRRALRDFENKASGAQIAVVYYAGHGVEVDGVNYLIPVDATLERDTYVEDEAIPLSRVMTSVDGATGLRLVLLDACRNNPFVNKMQRSVSKRSIGRGLARIEPTGSTLVAYSAKEGTTAEDGNGRNSPYATALVANLKTPGLEVNFLFRRVRDEVISSTGGRQEPFVYGSLGSTPIYFVPAEETPAEPEVKVDIKPSITSTPSSEMAGAYDRAERINTLDAWDTFLEFCGAGAESGGIYCGLARAARQKLANASSGSSAAPRDADAGATGDTKLAALSDPAAKSDRRQRRFRGRVRSLRGPSRRRRPACFGCRRRRQRPLQRGRPRDRGLFARGRRQSRQSPLPLSVRPGARCRQPQ